MGRTIISGRVAIKLIYCVWATSEESARIQGKDLVISILSARDVMFDIDIYVMCDEHYSYLSKFFKENHVTTLPVVKDSKCSLISKFLSFTEIMDFEEFWFIDADTMWLDDIRKFEIESGFHFFRTDHVYKFKKPERKEALSRFKTLLKGCTLVPGHWRKIESSVLHFKQDTRFNGFKRKLIKVCNRFLRKFDTDDILYNDEYYFVISLISSGHSINEIRKMREGIHDYIYHDWERERYGKERYDYFSRVKV